MPLLVDLQPAGRFLMEDLYRAGGLLAVLREVRDLLDPTALTVTGEPLVDYLDDAAIWDRRGDPAPGASRCVAEAGIAVLRGNLAPDGAVIKPAAASPAPAAAPRPGGRLRLASRTCTPASTTRTSTSTPTRCWCCAAAGRKGYPGMPEVANLPLPAQAARAGRPRHGADLRRPDERHRVRHRGPARRARGRGRRPARPGPHRRRRSSSTSPPAASTSTSPTTSWPPATPAPATVDGFAAPDARLGTPLRRHTSLQADTGADLDFLVGSSGRPVARESH